ncbi:DUF4231 domain-containing protein [Agrobacterium vitis]|uniref:DUF4231 domain-containing protein n=1 Tax=Agrobacterium vitis TaxID=373 RepID=A0AAE4WBJ7_AGRVI|nr:SLATT domain-containing protein [Agrobacterium vitis]MCF1502028.1 DUF4231 domain-containing protein [Allorhizobium sp. Av2]MCM2439665.1 DUF4231 domain-containing protein [Agrobacterium vitis]MUZ57438.1 DUF4231 domain-containing protein [Agrobacterium vitis]MVA69298.1 DUF4231 domain-containing protein [Agrobacterium vitis]MVA86772.1 DUF4231 domain-containing protein [Agrobacterium vitis]
MNEDVDREIRLQIQKLERDTETTSASNFAVAQRWELYNICLGVTIVILSACATALGAISASEGISSDPTVQSFLIVFSTVISSAAAVLGSILTFLKPSERAARYREFGNKQKSLRNRLRVYHSVTINFADDPKERHAALRKFLTEKDALNSDNPPIPRWAFKQASKDIADKLRRQGQAVRSGGIQSAN